MEALHFFKTVRDNVVLKDFNIGPEPRSVRFFYSDFF